MMLERGTWLVPTLHRAAGRARGRRAGMPLPKAAVEKARMVMEAHTGASSEPSRRA